MHQTVVVATQPLAFGAQLTRDNTSEIPWPTDRTLTGAFATKDELFKEGRRVVLSSIERNEPVLSTKITGPGQRATLSTLIEEGMRAVTVELTTFVGWLASSCRTIVSMWYHQRGIAKRPWLR